MKLISFDTNSNSSLQNKKEYLQNVHFIFTNGKVIYLLILIFLLSFYFNLNFLININKFIINIQKGFNNPNNISLKNTNDNKINTSLLDYFKNNNFLTNGRITVFANANGVYCKYIPIFCAGLLYSDKRNRTDIEIAINLPNLPKNIQKSLEYLRASYSNSKILIRYNAYKVVNNVAYLNGTKVQKNSIRFLIEPQIKNEYIFIGDIDIVYLLGNYYDNYLRDMFNRTSCYSNRVRFTDKHKLTGIHFSKWYCLYPIILNKKIDLNINDEALLYFRLINLGVPIDYNTKYRPIFGVHLSVSRKHVVNNYNNLDWEMNGKRKLWKNFTATKQYKFIYPLLDIYIVNKIKLLEEYYINHE